jgi:hypothetical protein
MVRVRVAILVLLLAGPWPVTAPGQETEGPQLNVVGAELQLSLPPGGSADPYSAPMGLGIYYARSGLPLGMAAGVSASLTSYYSRTSGFGPSRTVSWAASLGYPLRIDLAGSARVVLTPSIGGGLYHRWFEYEGNMLYVSRPVVSVLFAAELITGRRVAVGVSAGGTLILDNALRVTATLGERVGVVF